MNRRQAIRNIALMSVTLAGACKSDADENAFSRLTDRDKPPYADFSEYTLGGLLNIIKETQYSEHMKGAAEKAIEIMRQKNYRELIVGFGNRVYNLGEESITPEMLNLYLPSPIICRKDSNLLKIFISRISKNRSLVEEGIEWVIFTPNLTAEINGVQTEEAGLSTGNGITYVDTQAGNGQLRNQLEFAPVLTHEAAHEHPKFKGLPLIKRESIAHLKQKETAAEQKSKDATLEGMINSCTHRIQTAEYLSQEMFGSDFHNVYPTDIVLSRALLNARLRKEILEKYFSVNTRNPQLDKELSIAALIAHIVHVNNLKKATELLYELARDGDQLEKINAVSVIEILYPEKLASKSSPEWYAQRKRGVKAEKGWYDTSNLPSLNDLLNETRFNPRDWTRRLFRPQVKYEDVPNGNEVTRLSEENRHKNEYLQQMSQTVDEKNYQILVEKLNQTLGSFPGDPDGNLTDFTYKGWWIADSGTTTVMHQSKSIKIKNSSPIGMSQEIFLTKQDVYVKGKFGYTYWNFIDPYQDLDIRLHPPKFFK